jgi:CubicO group peptidase (beta-lactamase class C family)
MFTVAAHIIETYSAQTYTSFVEDRIFTPLGMSSSTFSPAKAGKTGRFTQGWAGNGRLLPECLTEEVVPLIAGPGGVISSAVDMVGAFCFRSIYQLTFLLPSSRNGLHCGLTRVCTIMSQSYRYLCIEMHRNHTPYPSVPRPILSSPLGGMVWVGADNRTWAMM